MTNKFLAFIGWQKPHIPTRQVKGKKRKPAAPKPVNLLTPTFEIGNELNIVNGIVAGTRPFTIASSLFLSTGERDAILASSGMGKSYLMGVILEEIIEKTNQVVFVFDPEGEWYTLGSHYDGYTIPGTQTPKAFKVMGKSGKNFIPYPVDLRFPYDADEQAIVDAVNAFEMKMAPMVRAMIAGGISCVFDMGKLGAREQLEAYTVIMEAIFRGENNLSEDDEDDHGTCRKVRIVVDEAHVFAPQKTTQGDHDKLSLEVTKKVSKRGRKRNVHIMVATQRPQSLNKDVLSQANRFWLGGVQSKLDYEASKSQYLDARKTLADVQKFKSGWFCYLGAGTVAMVKSRKRHCKHGGVTKKESTAPVASAAEADEILKGYLR